MSIVAGLLTQATDPAVRCVVVLASLLAAFVPGEADVFPGGFSSLMQGFDGRAG